MSDTLYESYNTGDDFDIALNNDARKWGQTFTPSNAHDITSVKLKLFKTNSPGDMTVEIYATDGSGHPTGAALASGTIAAADISSTSSPGDWYECTFGSSALLSASTKYGIVLSTSGTWDATNFIVWREDGSSATYSGGNYMYLDTGTWYDGPNDDFMFEEYGTAAATPSENVIAKSFPLKGV